MPLTNLFEELLTKLAPEAVAKVTELVEGALASDDPSRFVERRLIADGAHAASRATLQEALHNTTE